jgi:hypothetical protein
MHKVKQKDQMIKQRIKASRPKLPKFRKEQKASIASGEPETRNVWI